MVGCNETYLAAAIVALKQFQSYHPDYPLFVLGTHFSTAGHDMAESFGVQIREVDLSADFIDLDKRHKQFQTYPIECFHHIYSPVAFKEEFSFVVTLEPDICTNKTLEIDWTSVKYIAAGRHPLDKIKTYSCLMNDIHKIKKRWPEVTVGNNYRHAGGVRIYNVEALNRVNFYHNVVHFYQESLKIGARRNGDDSLMTMYQMFHPDHVLVWPTTFNLISEGRKSPPTSENLRAIQFYHLGGDHKYWKVSTNMVYTPLPEVRYFKDKMVRFLYNHFPLHFIRDAFPSLYQDTSRTVVPIYYFGSCDNFGDFITPYLLKRLCDRAEYTFVPESKSIKVLNCGSIMRVATRETLVCGAGIRDRKQSVSPCVVQSVRGPLTQTRLHEVGGHCPPIYGDPGLLLPQVYPRKATPEYDLGIVPHVVHYTRAVRAYKGIPNTRIIDLRTRDVEKVVDQLASCRAVLSSSLHGLIVSDAYGIPNRWIYFTNEIRGDGTKFLDYFASVGRSCTRPLDLAGFAPLPPDILAPPLPPPPLQKIAEVTELLREHMFIDLDKGGITPYTKYLIESLRQKAR